MIRELTCVGIGIRTVSVYNAEEIQTMNPPSFFPLTGATNTLLKELASVLWTLWRPAGNCVNQTRGTEYHFIYGQRNYVRSKPCWLDRPLISEKKLRPEPEESQNKPASLNESLENMVVWRTENCRKPTRSWNIQLFRIARFARSAEGGKGYIKSC